VLRAVLDGRKLDASLAGRLWFPLVVLALGLVVTAALTYVMRDSVEQEAGDHFELQAEQAKNAIAARIQSYSDALYAVRALFHTSARVTQEDFRNFVAKLELQTRYPALRLLNYAAYVPGAEREKLVAEIRADATGGAAAQAFAIRPREPRAFHYVITHVAPLEGNERSFGLDIGAPPFRPDALEYGRDTGRLVSSGRIIRFEDGVDNIALRIAVYRPGSPTETLEQRRAAYIGSVGAGFRIANLMRGVLEEHNLHHIDFQVFDVDRASAQKALVFDNALGDVHRAAGGGGAGIYVSRREIDMGGRLWELEFRAPLSSLASSFDLHMPWVVLGCGVLTSLMLAAILFFITTSRHRALVLAKRINQDLHAKEAGLAEAQRMARLGSWEISGQKRQMIWSEELFRVLGMQPHAGRLALDDFLGIVHPGDRQKVRDMLRLSSEPGAVLELEHRLLLRDGSERWVISKAKLEEPLSEGGVWRGTTMDITERKRAESRLQTEHQVSAILASGRHIEAVLGELLQLLCVRLNMACAVHWTIEAQHGLRSEAHNALRCAQVWCNDTVERGSRVHLQLESFGSPLGRLAAQKREAVLAADLAQRMPPLPVGGDARIELHSAAAFPIVAANRAVGVIELFGETRTQLDGAVAELLGSISAHLGQYHQKALAEEALELVPAHDPITGLPNRLEFQSRLSLALARARRERARIAVLLVDLDRFALLSANMRPGAGERLLQECARRIEASLRGCDTLARAGGDGFLAMLESGERSSDLIAVVRKVLDSVARPFAIDGRGLTFSASAGISLYPEDGIDAPTLLNHADMAMVRAKQEAPGGWRFFAASVNEEAKRRSLTEAGLQRALERGELVLHYQPRASLATGRITGVEALVRWNHPERGLLEPAEFIPLAEETGLIALVDGWVLKAACTHAQAWRQQGLAELRVSVNLSARRFCEESLVDDAANVVRSAGLAAQALELHVPESALARFPAQVAQTLHELKSRGFGLAIDGFGTGCAPLSQLQMFPFDALNIDRSLVSGIPDDRQDTALAGSMVHLARALGMRAAAVGVETAAQLEHLESFGCEEIQGHFVARAATQEALTPALLEGRTGLVQN
jgi:diguanylate cyclase (GGDEF)-like protein